jgi:hypothetical protein
LCTQILTFKNKAPFYRKKKKKKKKKNPLAKLEKVSFG